MDKVSINTFGQTVSYVYKLHFFETYVTGKYYDAKVCMFGTEKCAENFSVYAVESASPEF